MLLPVPIPTGLKGTSSCLRKGNPKRLKTYYNYFIHHLNNPKAATQYEMSFLPLFYHPSSTSNYAG
jgi:hypothetical protein